MATTTGPWPMSARPKTTPAIATERSSTKRWPTRSSGRGAVGPWSSRRACSDGQKNVADRRLLRLAHALGSDGRQVLRECLRIAIDVKGHGPPPTEREHEYAPVGQELLAVAIEDSIAPLDCDLGPPRRPIHHDPLDIESEAGQDHGQAPVPRLPRRS